jgi:ATP-dependent Clp protease ATP-binding subunit ClpC
VRYTEEALEAAVYQSNRYIPDRFLPDKAIDVIDEAGARVKLRVRREPTPGVNTPRSASLTEERLRSNYLVDNLTGARLHEEDDLLVSVSVTKDDIEDVIARWTGIPINSLKEEETQKLLRIEIELHHRVVAQRPAISALARSIRRSRAGLKNPQRPVGSFLF